MAQLIYGKHLPRKTLVELFKSVNVMFSKLNADCVAHAKRELGGGWEFQPSIQEAKNKLMRFEITRMKTNN